MGLVGKLWKRLVHHPGVGAVTEQPQVVGHRHPCEDIGVIGNGGDASSASLVGCRRGDVGVAPTHSPCGSGNHPCGNTDGARLPGSIAAQQHHHRTQWTLDGDTVQCFHRTVPRAHTDEVEPVAHTPRPDSVASMSGRESTSPGLPCATTRPATITIIWCAVACTNSRSCSTINTPRPRDVRPWSN